jgi:hypothetical protein
VGLWVVAACSVSMIYNGPCLSASSSYHFDPKPLTAVSLTSNTSLPRSGGVVFTIRTYFHPITDICREPYVPGRLASAVRSWGDDVSKYKGKERYGDVLLEYLDKMHQQQVDEGLDLSREEDAHSYPY